MAADRFWFRTFAEGGAILLSILAAFAVDAWWDTRLEVEAEGEAIGRLIREFEQTDSALTRIDRSIRIGGEAERGGMEGMRRFLMAMGTEMPGPAVDSLLANAITVYAISLPDAALRSLVSSGQFEILRSDSLREVLSGWEAHRARVQEDRQAMRVLVSERIIPYLWDRVSLRAIDVQSGFHEELGPGPFVRDSRPLLSDPYFENLLNERLISEETALERAQEALAHVRLILDILRSEQARWN